MNAYIERNTGRELWKSKKKNGRDSVSVCCVRPITILYIYLHTHMSRDHAYVGYMSAHKIVNSQQSNDPPRRVNEKTTDHVIIKK